MKETEELTYVMTSQTTQSNLQIQFNPYQTTNKIIHKNLKTNHKTCTELHKTPDSQSNTKQRTKLKVSHLLTSKYTTKL